MERTQIIAEGGKNIVISQDDASWKRRRRRRRIYWPFLLIFPPSGSVRASLYHRRFTSISSSIPIVSIVPVAFTDDSIFTLIATTNQPFLLSLSLSLSLFIFIILLSFSFFFLSFFYFFLLICVCPTPIRTPILDEGGGRGREEVSKLNSWFIGSNLKSQSATGPPSLPQNNKYGTPATTTKKKLDSNTRECCQNPNESPILIYIETAFTHWWWDAKHHRRHSILKTLNYIRSITLPPIFPHPLPPPPPGSSLSTFPGPPAGRYAYKVDRAILYYRRRYPFMTLQPRHTFILIMCLRGLSGLPQGLPSDFYPVLAAAVRRCLTLPAPSAARPKRCPPRALAASGDAGDRAPPWPLSITSADANASNQKSMATSSNPQNQSYKMRRIIHDPFTRNSSYSVARLRQFRQILAGSISITAHSRPDIIIIIIISMQFVLLLNQYLGTSSWDVIATGMVSIEK